jgi:Ni/Fe-hydrogenase subunit HybB-like protein
VVIFEATLSSTGFKRQLETPVLTPLSKVMFGLLAAYVVVRVADLLLRGALGTAFAATWQAFWFWVEMACFVVPLVLLATEQARRSAAKLFVGAVLLMLGGFLLRINGFLVGYMTGEGWHYFPSLAELMVTVGLIAFEILAYIVIVRNYPVLPAAQPVTR